MDQLLPVMELSTPDCSSTHTTLQVLQRQMGPAPPRDDPMYIDLYQDHVKMLKLKMVLLNMSIFGTVYFKVSINRLGKQYRKDAHERLIKFSGCGGIFFKTEVVK